MSHETLQEWTVQAPKPRLKAPPVVLPVQTCSIAGREALVQQLLPQLIPLFTCAEPHRLNYGMHLPSRPSLKASPLAASPPADVAARPSQAAGASSPEPSSAATGPQTAEGGAAGGGPGGRSSSGTEEGGAPSGDEDLEAGGATGSDSGYWDVMSILYPPCLEAVGGDALHSLVPNWPVIELNLSVRRALTGGMPACLHREHLCVQLRGRGMAFFLPCLLLVVCCLCACQAASGQ